jgi:pimeloyl-ACP methyl ester carboxylesterase
VPPFKRLPFDTLPDKPHRPHHFLELPVEKVTIDSRVLGRLAIAVRQRGDGPPVLLLHGLMTSGYSWRYVIDELAARFRVIVPDLPGNGDSEPPAAPLTPEALTTFLGELIAALHIRGCFCVGNSMAGYLCMRLALDDAGVFARLVNIHSPALPTLQLRALKLVMSLPGARAVLRRMVHRDTRRWVHRNVHYYDESLKSLEEARVYGTPLESDAGVRAFASYLADTMAPRGFRQFLATLRQRRAQGLPFPVPLLHLYARQDPLVPAWIGPRIAELTQSPLEWLDATSHFMHVDTPAPVIAHLLAFLDGAAKQAVSG